MNSINFIKSICLFLIFSVFIGSNIFAIEAKKTLYRIEIRNGTINVFDADGERSLLSRPMKNADKDQYGVLSAQNIEQFARLYQPTAIEQRRKPLKLSAEKKAQALNSIPAGAQLERYNPLDKEARPTESSALASPNLTVYDGEGSENNYQYNEDTHVLSINTSVGNYGDAPASSFRVGYYLSPDEAFDNSDYFVASDTQDDLPDGYYVNMGASVDLDEVAGLPEGTYYVFFYIDDQDNVAESDENDNLYYFTTPFEFIPEEEGTPNLTLYTGSGAENNYEYDENSHVLNINSSVVNDGDAPASAFRVGYYLSINETWSSSDYFVAEDSQNSLTDGYYVNMGASVDLDNVDGLPAGTYYVIIYIDDQDAVDETDEDDNLFYFETPFEFSPEQEGLPNLTLYTGDGSQNNYSFDSATNMLTIQTSIQNSGDVSAGAFRLGYYLSIDESLDNSDNFITSDTRNSLTNGYYTNMSGSVDLDTVDGLSDGTYYVCFYIDDTYQVDESDENDNGYYFVDPIEYEAEGKKEPNIRVHPTELTITES